MRAELWVLIVMYGCNVFLRICPIFATFLLTNSINTDNESIPPNVDADESIAINVVDSINEHQETTVPAGRHVWSEDIFRMHK